MLEKMQSIAVKVSGLLAPFLLLAFLAFAFAGYVAVTSADSANDALFIPSVLTFCWALIASCFIVLFRVVPPAPDRQMPFFQRLGNRLKRALRLIVAAGFLALTVSLIVVTLKLLNTGIG